MSGDKASNPCSKFQANIFNKSKCQNCFKSRELHLLNDHDMEQAKPIYGGWLCLAPEGTDFDNPMQRSRKWQRRFFILYEHGSLTFALDELPSTLPQGTVNMNLCTDIADAEPRTGQRNALCVVTTEQEIFIRGDNKEIINGWSEQLAVYLRSNKQNQKKKRKVEPVATQEPSPAKMAATDLSVSASESGCGRWQEDQRGSRGLEKTPIWTVTDQDPPGLEQTPAGSTPGHLCPATRNPLSLDGPGGFRARVGSLDLVSNGSADPAAAAAESGDVQTSANNGNQSNGASHGGRADSEGESGASLSRIGRSEARASKREKLQSCGDITQLAAPPSQRRSKSLDRRTSDTVMTPDLLNFKKGWMVKLDDNGKWKKYWFVLSTDSLRYYRDSIAEEASDLDGEIDLTKCYNVSEYQVQRNYGFQIHTAKGVYTLSAMTAGIRKNWIQSLMKNVHPANAPDVANLPGLHAPCNPPDALPKPDLTQDSPSSDISSERDPQRRSVTDKRREGRYKTFDWAEFRPQSKPAPDADLQRSAAPCPLELADLERRKRREERRRRYESMLGFSLGWEAVGGESAGGSPVLSPVLSPRSQQRVAEDIEECWRQVETTMFRLDRTVPLFPEARDAAEMEKLLDSYKKGVEDLKTQLAESERLRRDLEARLSAAGYQQQRVCPLCDASPGSEAEPTDASNKPAGGLAESRELTQQESVTSEHQTPSIWLQDTEGNFQELRDLLPDWTETTATQLVSPTSDSEGQSKELDDVITKLQDQRNEDDCRQYSETQINEEYVSLILEKPADGGDGPPSPCVEKHIPPDQAVVRRLSQEVELLTSQNEALNQRNQEMLNQLTEADREIERLKAELSSRYTEPHHLPEVEQQVHAKLEDLERELGLRDRKLLDAQALIASLEENLRDTEALLQLAEPAEAEGSEHEESARETEGYLLRCFEATEVKLTELEKQLGQSEQTCRELRARSTELEEAEEVRDARAAETETDISRLSRDPEAETLRDEGEKRVWQVIEGMFTRLKVLGKILEVVSRLDSDATGRRMEGEREETALGQLRWEEEFWSSLLQEVKAGPSQPDEEELVELLLRRVAEQMIAEKQLLLLLGHERQQRRDAEEEQRGSDTLKDLDVVLDAAGAAEKMDEGGGFSEMFDVSKYELGHIQAVTQMKTSWLESITSSSVPDGVRMITDKLLGSSEQHPFPHFLHSVGTEAMFCCHISRLRSAHRRELEEARQKPPAAPHVCDNCVQLMEENAALRERLSAREDPQTADACCQADERETNPRVEAGTSTDELWADNERSDAPDEGAETDAALEMEKVLLLTEEVKTLEEQLSAIAEQLKDEFEGKMSSVRTQHEKEMERLKATFEYGLSSMEESHVKVVEELQRRQQLEVERLLAERDRVLEEETAATAIAIEAIQNAHRLELEKEVQRRWQSESSTQLEDVYRRHSEELASAQRELEVLSQQFCLKCLENEHLVQALDAERKALCQCQQENQDLRTRNQELSGHLAAEITRLCTLAKQDDLPLSQGMDVYQMEITLRVKDSEVQCLKQEIRSLKDELLSAHRDKRNATKKYKDIYAELSIVRAKTERELDELRENLRLANHALSRISP